MVFPAGLLLLLSFGQFFWRGLFVCLRMFCDVLFRGGGSFLGFGFYILRGGFYIGEKGLGRPSVADVDLADGSLGIDEDGSQVVFP